ncbi:ATP-binding protein [Novosphingobium mathurense]|uniref:histidine kinase n=1 Tax=Novosphingobium mathurense TaxID=428990 RepID=A0A1U6IRN6_9SPHN|nr:ATP-binding protein [Novosphingobium mathurense]SLK10670.1 Signal transduction histidine kinase [Novosphingobium mathurense]
MTPPSLPRRFGLPLAMQMIAIIVCALIGAQLVTLALTVILPPSPTARWDLVEVAAALTGKDAGERLERKSMDGPPDVSGQGWLVSESSRQALARRLGRQPGDVVLAFYTQLPVGGVAVPPDAHSPLAVVQSAQSSIFPGLLIEEAQAQSIPGGPPPGGAPSAGGMPGGGFPGGMPPGGSIPHGPAMPAGSPPRLPSPPAGSTASGSIQGLPGGALPRNGAVGSSPGPASGPVQIPSGPGGGAATGSAGQGNRPSQPPSGQFPASQPTTSQPAPRMLVPGGMKGPITPAGNALPAVTAIPRSSTPKVAVQPTPKPTAAPDTSLLAPRAEPGLAPAVPSPLATAPTVDLASRVPSQRQQHTPGTATAEPQPIPFRRTRSSLFDAASPPFIEGDFVAAARQPDGHWLAVAPRAEPFPNSWQKRVTLWFLLSLAIVSPLAWLFARRIVDPLRDFAKAAEQLGRDPSATILPLSGPAEIGRAANAFNQMRYRLRAFVDDRTAMVGAISHDLRTPLTRLRFRIEDVADEQREGLLKEVTEMEQMISQVITFIRDASTPGPREHLDFAELIAGSVADAQLVGGDVEIEQNAHIPVEIDPVGMRRLLGNLLENAVKYGERARVRVRLSGDEAIAEIVDTGPGIPEDEFDRAFEPFYRSEAARKSGRTGSGLGLAVCRSIARAHGGDVSFAHGADGFTARVSVPVAANPVLRKAA